MIFVSVGTHEQQFDRLIKFIDDLKTKGKINEEVYIQSGYSKYESRQCKYKNLIQHAEMVDQIRNCRIFICHGGPGTIFLAFKNKKIPVVVPRMKKYGEHVDNHQVDFVKRLEGKKKIVAVYEINDLKKVILNFSDLIKDLKSHEGEEIDSLVAKLVEYCDVNF